MRRILTSLILAFAAGFCLADPLLGLNITQTPTTTPLVYWIDSKGGLWGVLGNGYPRKNLAQLQYAKDEASPWNVIYTFPSENGNTDIIRNIWVSPKQTIFCDVYNNVHEQLRRSADGGKTWATILDLPTEYSFLGRDNINWDSYGDMFMVIYHSAFDLPPGMDSVWRSMDDGATFQRTLTVDFPGTIRHFHQVYPDPYTPGSIYALAGDGDVQARIYMSKDRGTTWSLIANGHDARAVGIGFFPNTIVWGTDQPYLDRWSMVYDRKSRLLTSKDGIQTQIFWVNQMAGGLVALGRSNEVGYGCELYTMAAPTSGSAYKWQRTVIWYGDPVARQRSEFHSSNVGPKGQFYLQGIVLQGSPMDNPRQLRVDSFASDSTSAYAKTLPFVRPRF